MSKVVNLEYVNHIETIGGTLANEGQVTMIVYLRETRPVGKPSEESKQDFADAVGGTVIFLG